MNKIILIAALVYMCNPPEAPKPLVLAKYRAFTTLNINQVTDSAIEVFIGDFRYINSSRLIGELHCNEGQCNGLHYIAATNGGTHFIYAGTRVVGVEVHNGYSTTRTTIDSYNGSLYNNHRGTSHTTTVPSYIEDRKEYVYDVYRVDDISSLPQELRPILINDISTLPIELRNILINIPQEQSYIPSTVNSNMPSTVNSNIPTYTAPDSPFSTRH